MLNSSSDCCQVWVVLSLAVFLMFVVCCRLLYLCCTVIWGGEKLFCEVSYTTVLTFLIASSWSPEVFGRDVQEGFQFFGSLFLIPCCRCFLISRQDWSDNVDKEDFSFFGDAAPEAQFDFLLSCVV
eukprot:Lithocolla_globosa_v1_NODE_1439_length_2574_cov_13.629218.p3 type:complete len:126 gc:universal NODE_1439_length_2574_cov_13.629218:1231-854(-)